MPNIVIAFTGKARAGKSESASILQELVDQDNGTFVKISFAGALKEIATKYWGWDGDKGLYKQQDSDELVPDKGRQLLINIGMKFREIRPTIWADIAYEKLLSMDASAHPSQKLVYCVDDLRFKNEVNALKKYKGKAAFIKLVRKEQLDINDISEKDLDGVEFEYTIENNGSKEELRKNIKEIYDELIAGEKNGVTSEI